MRARKRRLRTSVLKSLASSASPFGSLLLPSGELNDEVGHSSKHCLDSAAACLDHWWSVFKSLACSASPFNSLLLPSNKLNDEVSQTAAGRSGVRLRKRSAAACPGPLQGSCAKCQRACGGLAFAAVCARL